MRTPQKLRKKGRQARIDYAVERLKSRKHFHPSKKYNLLVQREHDRGTKRRMRSRSSRQASFLDKPGSSLIKRNAHWEKVTPLRKIHLPSRHDVGREKTAIHDLTDKDDFIEWFENKFSDLQDGVYTALQRAGKGKGWNYLFVLEWEAGEVNQWKRKSNGTKYRNSSDYYMLPFYFYQLRRVLGED